MLKLCVFCARYFPVGGMQEPGMLVSEDQNLGFLTTLQVSWHPPAFFVPAPSLHGEKSPQDPTFFTLNKIKFYFLIQNKQFYSIMISKNKLNNPNKEK